MKSTGWKGNLAALLLAQTLVMVAFSFVFPFLPLFIQELGVTETAAVTQWAGVMAAASSLAMAIAQPIWGSMADRWGRKPMVIRSMLCASVIVTLMAFASTPEQLLVLRLLQGGFTGTVAASTVLVATSTPKHQLGFALGLMQVAVFAGNSVGPLLGGVIADTVGFRVSFFAAGVLMLVGVAIVITTVRENFTRPADDGRRVGMFGESKALLALSLFPMVLVVNFLTHIGPVVVSPILPLFVAELSGGENVATSAGIVLAGTGVASAIAAVIFGRYGDRLGHGMIISLCSLGMAATYFPQAWVQDVWQLFALRLMMGVFSGGLAPSTSAIVTNVVPVERQGIAFGVISSVNAISNTVGPLAGAGIATQWGLRAVFPATGALFLLTFGWVTAGFRRRPLPRQQHADGVQAPGLSNVVNVNVTEKQSRVPTFEDRDD